MALVTECVGLAANDGRFERSETLKNLSGRSEI
jgi:hypothetical protein